jgi:hypothetical protein
MPSKALEIFVCFHIGPVLGELGGTLLSYSLREKGKISLSKEMFPFSRRPWKRNISY